MSSSNTAISKLRTVRSPQSNLHSTISQVSGNEIHPRAPLADTVYADSPYTFQWNYEEQTSNLSPGKVIKLDIDQNVGDASCFTIEFDFPDQDGSSVTINYAPMVALACVKKLDVKYGNELIHTFDRKQLYELIMYVNEKEYRHHIIENFLGDAAPNGSTTVTNPGRVSLPIPMEGMNLQGGRESRTAPPVPINAIRGDFTVEVTLAPTSDYCDSSDGLPNFVRLWYKQLVTPDYLSMRTVTSSGGNSNEFYYPTRWYEAAAYDNKSLSSGSWYKQDISDLAIDGEMITMLVHITTTSDDGNNLYFNHEPIEAIQLRLKNEEIVDIETPKAYQIEYFYNYYIKPYTWGSVKPASGEPNSLVTLSISERDLDYESYVGNGANPDTKPMSLWIKSQSSITANIHVTAVYRAMLDIDTAGTAHLVSNPYGFVGQGQLGIGSM